MNGTPDGEGPGLGRTFAIRTISPATFFQIPNTLTRLFHPSENGPTQTRLTRSSEDRETNFRRFVASRLRVSHLEDPLHAEAR